MKLSIVPMLAAAALFAVPAVAQDQEAQMQMLTDSARNQLGILIYCENEGYIDTAAIEVQERIIEMLPPAADAASGDEAQAAGEEGRLEAMGVT